MKPYCEKDGITIYHGDCRDVLPTLEVEVDVLLTDPPYAICNRFDFQRTTHNGGKRKLQFEWDGDDALEVVLAGITAGSAICHKKASAFVFCGSDTLTPIQCVLRSAGFTPKLFGWTKPFPPPPAPGTWWPSAFEIALYAYRPNAWFGDTSLSRKNVIQCDSYRHGQPGKVNHPTQKPLALVTKIVCAMCSIGGTILDPFSGSGTTLIAARDCSCRAVGVEIEERYCEIAANRLSQSVIFQMESV